LNFFFVALALFMVVKLYNRFRSNDDKEKAALNTNDLLVEIRDELRATRNNDKQ
jgi:large-conductance mechanosensitive channel